MLKKEKRKEEKRRGASESRKYSTAEGRRSGWSAEGGVELTTHTSALTCWTDEEEERTG